MQLADLGSTVTVTPVAGPRSSPIGSLFLGCGLRCGREEAVVAVLIGKTGRTDSFLGGLKTGDVKTARSSCATHLAYGVPSHSPFILNFSTVCSAKEAF